MEILGTCFPVILIIWYTLYIVFVIYLTIMNNGMYSVNDVIVPTATSLPDLSIIMYRKIKPEVLTASIVKLINNGNIELKKVDDDFILIRKDDKNLSKSDFNALELLFSTVGEANRVSLNDLNNFCENSRNCSEFLLVYDIWKKLAVIDSNKSSLFEPKMDYKKVKFFEYTGILLFILNIVIKKFYLLGFLIIIPSIFIVIYFYHISKLTEEASKKYYGFLKLRKDIKENSKLLKDDNYLQYSIILKCFDNLEDKDELLFIQKLDLAINRCYKNAFFRGNRSFFK